GGITSLAQARTFLDAGLVGVMIGRAAYHAPCDVLGQADAMIFGDPSSTRDAHDVVEDMLPYIEGHLADGGRLHSVTRHMLGLFAGRPGARAWRRTLSEGATRPGAGLDLVRAALAAVPRQVAA
ncbi:MAG: tRNA-dihydrouridine synthase, partial [Pseudomonadota bacterium]